MGSCESIKLFTHFIISYRIRGGFSYLEALGKLRHGASAFLLAELEEVLTSFN